MTVKYDGDIARLTKQLTDPFADKLLKVRAIFRWITDNIEYDYKFYNKTSYKGKEPKPFECFGDSMTCETKKQVWENSYINKALDNKKAVCQGYSMLFARMCKIAGVEAEVVPGYIRTQYYEVGNMGDLDHAWNSVLINGSWYLVDVTWAAGGCTADEDGKLLAFVKRLNEYYWLTPPADFAKNHYPEEPKWVLIANYKQDDFAANPYYASDEVGNIKLISPKSGIIIAKKGDTIRFKLKYSGHFDELQINTNIFQNPDVWMLEYISKHKAMRVPDTLAIKKQQYVKYRQNGDTYEFAYIVKDNTLEYLEILFDKRRVMRFKVKSSR